MFQHDAGIFERGSDQPRLSPHFPVGDFLHDAAQPQRQEGGIRGDGIHRGGNAGGEKLVPLFPQTDIFQAQDVTPHPSIWSLGVQTSSPRTGEAAADQPERSGQQSQVLRARGALQRTQGGLILDLIHELVF